MGTKLWTSASVASAHHGINSLAPQVDGTVVSLKRLIGLFWFHIPEYLTQKYILPLKLNRGHELKESKEGYIGELKREGGDDVVIVYYIYSIHI